MSQEAFGNPIVNLGFTYKVGLGVSYSSATVVNINAGQARDISNTWDMVYPVGSQTPPATCSLAFTGVNGLDTGTVANNTWYYLYEIMDTTNLNPTAFIFSLSASGPLMPSLNGRTYSAYRLLDCVLTDGSGHILLFYNNPTGISGGGSYKQWDAPISVLTAGTATSFTAIDLSVAIPPAIFGRVIVTGTYEPHGAADTLSIQPTGATGTALTIPGVVASVAQPVYFEIVPLLASAKPEISYKISSATSPAAVSLSVLGFSFAI